MTWWQLALPGALAGTGLAAIVTAFIPRRIHPAAALERLGTTTPPHAVAASTATRVGDWVHRHLPDVRGFRIPTADLSLLGIPTSSFLYRKTIGAAFGLTAPLLIAAIGQAVGRGTPLWLWLLIAAAGAIVGWVGPDRHVRARAFHARTAFTQAMAVYVGLIAVELSDGTTGPAYAMANAATVADSPVFQRIREELTLAEYTGTTQWDALERLAASIQLPALTDAARTMRLAGDGALVTDALNDAADSLRNVVLTNAHAAANAQSVRVGIPLALTVLVLAGMFATPAVLTMLTR